MTLVGLTVVVFLLCHDGLAFFFALDDDEDDDPVCGAAIKLVRRLGSAGWRRDVLSVSRSSPSRESVWFMPVSKGRDDAAVEVELGRTQQDAKKKDFAQVPARWPFISRQLLRKTHTPTWLCAVRHSAGPALLAPENNAKHIRTLLEKHPAPTHIPVSLASSWNNCFRLSDFGLVSNSCQLTLDSLID